MSFDLLFYTSGPRGPHSSSAGNDVQEESLERRMRAWLAEAANVRTWARDRGFQASYENADTGVSFTFLHSPGREGGGQPPEPYAYTGLSISVPCVRPIFFGMEAVVLVRALCRDFGFTVLDPQADGDGAKTARPYSGEDLIMSWSRTNAATIESLLPAMRKKPLVMSRDKAIAWWRYQMLCGQMEHGTGEGTWLPHAHVVFDEAECQLRTMTVWLPETTQLLPDFDYVLMKLPPKRGSTEPEARLVWRKDFVAAARHLLRPANLEDDFPGALFVPENATAAIQAAARQMPEQPPANILSSTAFIDVAL